MALTEAKIRRELRALLQTVDFETESERTVREKLAKKLRCNLDDWKEVVKDAIHAFIDEEAEGPSHDADSPPKPSAKRKKAEGARAAGSKAAKATKVSSKARPTAPRPKAGTMGKGKWNKDGRWITNLSDTKRVSVHELKGNVLVDVREFYQKDSDWLPGRKGASLNLEQWALVKTVMDEVVRKIQQGITSHVLDLGGNKRLQLRPFKSIALVDLREFYMKGSEERPGKGISLTGDLFATFAKRRQDIDAAVEALGGDPSQAVTMPDGGSPQKNGEINVDMTDFSLPLDHTNEVRATVGEFNGTILFGLRIFLWKSGKLVPGYKGISLKPEQFETLMANSDDISSALASMDTSLRVDLSHLRRANITTYGGKAKVDIREYYNAGGDELKPGRKGICLTKEQWGELIASEALLRNEADKL